MRRIARSVLETYGYAPKGTHGSAEKRQSFGDFFFKYVAVAAAFGGLGYEVGEFNPVLASALYLLALAVFFRGFSAWSNTRPQTVGLYLAVGIAALPTPPIAPSPRRFRFRVGLLATHADSARGALAPCQ